MSWQVWIPSRKRTRYMQHSLHAFPYAKILVHQSEYDDYIKVVPKEQLYTHNCKCMSQIRKNILQRSESECTVTIDDDIHMCYSRAGQKLIKIEDPKDLYTIIDNNYNICKDLGIKMFGYASVITPLYYAPHCPINLNKSAVDVIGIFDKSLYPDQNLRFADDIDITLQCLYKNRIVYCDDRFFWSKYDGRTLMFKDQGGCTGLRTGQAQTKDRQYLKAKWGKYLYMGTKNPSKGQGYKPQSNVLMLKVNRRNPVVPKE